MILVGFLETELSIQRERRQVVRDDLNPGAPGPADAGPAQGGGQDFRSAPLTACAGGDGKSHDAGEVVVLDAEGNGDRSARGILDREQSLRRLDGVEYFSKRRLERRILPSDQQARVNEATDIMRGEVIDRIRQCQASEIRR